MGTVTKTIGSAGGRDYSTLASWEAALPANLVTDGNAQVGECYNDSEFAVASGVNPVVTISGQTTDTTNTITLKCAAGQSFRDNANVQTNALRYNASNGVAIRKTNNYTNAIDALSNNVKFHGLQVKHGASASTSNNAIYLGGTNGEIDFCILEAGGDHTSYSVVQCQATGAKIRNTLLINTNSNDSDGVRWRDTANTFLMVNCTIVRPSNNSAAASTGIAVIYGTSANGTLKNTAIFGFSEFISAGKSAAFGTASNNASNNTIGFGTSNQASLTYTDQFEASGTLSGSMNFKPSSTGSLVNNGVTDTTNGPNDIAGTARPSGAAYDIGCWELVAAAAAIIWDGARQSFNHMMVR